MYMHTRLSFYGWKQPFTPPNHNRFNPCYMNYSCFQIVNSILWFFICFKDLVQETIFNQYTSERLYDFDFTTLATIYDLGTLRPDRVYKLNILTILTSLRTQFGYDPNDLRPYQMYAPTEFTTLGNYRS